MAVLTRAGYWIHQLTNLETLDFLVIRPSEHYSVSAPRSFLPRYLPPSLTPARRSRHPARHHACYRAPPPPLPSQPAQPSLA